MPNFLIKSANNILPTNDIIAYEPSRTTFADLDSVSNRIDIANKVNHRLVETWNNAIGKNDTVLHLGDLAWGGQDRLLTA